jgi:ABC-type bacteriocin/lantibiotic exporter with double-glycine peptidase domain
MMLRALATALTLASSLVGTSGAPHAARTQLDVPVLVQTPQRCGQAALEMVFRFYGAGSEAIGEADRAYDPILRGSLVTDLAAAARRAGYEATIATLTPDSLVQLLAAGVPPIVLYQNGRPPFTLAHYGVVSGWDAERATFTINDGQASPRTVHAGDFAKRWRTAGSQALIVRRSEP